MRWLRNWQTRLLFFVSIVGPGFITANVNNEAGGIFTYSFSGAKFGYSLLWTLLPITIALIVVQEMGARMGAITGKGLSDLIREEYGFRITFFMMLGLVITNFGNVVAEFAGIATSLQLFGLSKYVTVPIAAVIVWAIVVLGDYRSVEKIFLLASLVYIGYIVAGVLSRPDWSDALLSTVTLPSARLIRNTDYLYLMLAVIGATIAPWMQFYLQASIVEKGITERQYPAVKLDVISGSIFAPIVAGFIIIACAATLHETGMRDIRDAADAAQALRPLAGDYAFILFAVGLANASLFAASILPLSTAYTVCEGLGFESGLDKKFGEAPVFYWLYTLLIAAGAGVILWPDFPLLKITVFSQVLNALLLPFVLIFLLRLVNREYLMGDRVNSRSANLIGWTTAAVLIVLTLGLLALTLRS